MAIPKIKKYVNSGKNVWDRRSVIGLNTAMHGIKSQTSSDDQRLIRSEFYLVGRERNDNKP